MHRMYIHRLMHAGFTMVEIMIVVALIGILAAVGLPAMRSYVESTTAQQYASLVNNVFREGRAQAIQRNTRVSAILATDGFSWCLIDRNLMANPIGTPTCDATQAQLPEEIKKFFTVTRPKLIIVGDALTWNSLGLSVSNPDGRNRITQVNVEVGSSKLRVQVSGSNTRVCDPNRSVGTHLSC